ncbi:hypothetical protein JCM11641_001178 [Rhodosporidiobolus odoratus]
MSDPSSSSSHPPSSSSSPFQPQLRPPRPHSAFPRLANVALSSAASATSSTSSSPASVSLPSSALPPAPPGSRGAFDALEHIAHLNEGRLRQSSLDSASGRKGKGKGKGKGKATSTSTGDDGEKEGGRFSSSRRGWRSRGMGESRSRERSVEAEDPSVAEPASSLPGEDEAGATANLPQRTQSYWGMEVLPPNALSPSDPAAGPGNPQFFQPTAVSSEHFGAFWDGYHRSPTATSPSIFGAERPSPPQRFSSTESSPSISGILSSPIVGSPASAGSSSVAGSSVAGFSPVQPWSPPSSAAAVRSAGSSAVRTSSPLGGGKKLKEQSRKLKFTLQTVSRDKGLVGLAKPHQDAEQGRVAVAGKTYLKILKVPYGLVTPRPSAPPTVTPTPVSSYSIAYRRSRSRGSPAPLDRARGAAQFVGAKDERSAEEVSEVVDVRAGSRLGPAFLFSDVSWGFGGTADKLATSFTNGAVALWDLAKEGGSRLDQIKHEHDRAVNRVVFGGMTGNFLMSGGQDGQIKLWDVRSPGSANITLKAASPVRHLSFSPSASQPFTLLAACASGTLIRYDVRYVSRQNGGATDRIAGHVGSILSMDWRDGFSCERTSGGGGGGVGASLETAGGGREGGWVVTGGADKTIKIWDFSLTTLATKPVRTLYASQAVRNVAWHPSRATELASSPLPSLGGKDDGGRGETDRDREGKERSRAWKSEIEIWDVRRPYFPKVAIRTEEPTAALLYNDDETLWSLSKATATFFQHDVASDSYSLLDSIDRPSTSWTIQGELAFVEDGRREDGVPFERQSREMAPADAPKFRPELFLNTVGELDPDFDTDSFAYLANNLEITGNFSEVCENNAKVCSRAGRSDASHVWLSLRTWLNDEPFSGSDSSPPTPTANSPDTTPRSHALGIPFTIKASVAPEAATSQELYRLEGEKHTREAREAVKRQLREILKEYADRGDAQLCATVCCALRDKNMEFEPLWATRVSKTYLDLLRRLKLHVPAAKINKYCANESLRALTQARLSAPVRAVIEPSLTSFLSLQNTVIFHTACGKCGKAIETAPFGYCSKCSAQVAKCCICHLAVESLYVFCATCGHGAHADCLDSFASSIATTLASSQPQTPVDLSHPSTPGMATPLRNWMWGEGGSGLVSPVEEEGEDGADLGSVEQSLRRLVASCPAACGHSPCMLSVR